MDPDRLSKCLGCGHLQEGVKSSTKEERDEASHHRYGQLNRREFSICEMDFTDSPSCGRYLAKWPILCHLASLSSREAIPCIAAGAMTLTPSACSKILLEQVPRVPTWELTAIVEPASSFIIY